MWDYPRPPALQPFAGRIRIDFGGLTIVNTTDAWRVLETSHPPVYYLPPDTIDNCVLEPVAGESFCEWKGSAQYYDVACGDRRARRAAWSYPEPSAAFEPIRGYVAFYAAPMDACWVDGERVTPQPGGFYGGWITSNLVGPFKGGPDTVGW